MSDEEPDGVECSKKRKHHKQGTLFGKERDQYAQRETTREEVGPDKAGGRQGSKHMGLCRSWPEAGVVLRTLKVSIQRNDLLWVKGAATEIGQVRDVFWRWNQQSLLIEGRSSAGGEGVEGLPEVSPDYPVIVRPCPHMGPASRGAGVRLLELQVCSEMWRCLAPGWWGSRGCRCKGERASRAEAGV